MDLLLMRALATKLNLVHKLHLESRRGGSIEWQGPQQESHLALWKCRMRKGWPRVQMCLLTERELESANNKESKRFWQYKANVTGSLLSNCYLVANPYVRWRIIDGVTLDVIRFIQAPGYCLFSMPPVVHESHLMFQSQWHWYHLSGSSGLWLLSVNILTRLHVYAFLCKIRASQHTELL